MSDSKNLIILASSSPRRKQLLSIAGFDFKVSVPAVDEKIIKGELSEMMVERLAEEKAFAVAASTKLKPNLTYYIIGSDTTVVIGKNREALGKPKNAKDAEKMLKKISGKTHEVLTAFCILELSSDSILKRNIIKTVSTKVTITKLTEAFIKKYVKTGEPLDKAGSYGAQGIGMSIIDKIEGSYTNVVGLPMTELTDTFISEFKVYPKWMK